MQQGNGSILLLKVIRAYGWFITVHIVLAVGGFSFLYKLVSRSRPREPSLDSDLGRLHLDRSLDALELARQLYFKSVACLHFAAASTLFLRSEGFRVQMVFGVAPRPFLAHTWVELGGQVLVGTRNRPLYTVLDVI